MWLPDSLAHLLTDLSPLALCTRARSALLKFVVLSLPFNNLLSLVLCFSLIRGCPTTLLIIQFSFSSVGILISFWIDYGTSTIDSDAQWRLPLALQLIIGLILGVGILFFPFSPRWLMSQNREEDALKVISRLRRLPPDNPVVEEEWREIKATVEFDRQVQRERYPQHINNGAKGRFMIGLGGYMDLFRKGIFKRLWLGCALQFFQQFTGINAIIVSFYL